jgi:hypothetical protein
MERPGDRIYTENVTIWELPKDGSTAQVVQNGHCVWTGDDYSTDQ